MGLGLRLKLNYSKAVALKNKKNFYICTPKLLDLTRGVMVALQILVLPVQVRILAGQQKSRYRKFPDRVFCFLLIRVLFRCETYPIPRKLPDIQYMIII